MPLPWVVLLAAARGRTSRLSFSVQFAQFGWFVAIGVADPAVRQVAMGWKILKQRNQVIQFQDSADSYPKNAQGFYGVNRQIQVVVG